MLEQVEDDRHGLLVGDLIGDVDRRALEILRDAALADALGDRRALGLELAGRVVAVERGAHRIGDGDLRLTLALFERDADARERPAGADRAHEAVDLALGLRPDLRPGGLDVALAVGDVVELVRPDRAMRLRLVELLGEPTGDLHVIVRIGIGHRRHLDQLRPAQAQRVFLLLALRVGNDDDGAIAERVGDERKADAGVAGGSLDDHPAGPERPALDRVLDDEQRGAILDRLARIHELGLAENGASGALGRMLELDQRRVADRLDDIVANLHGGRPVTRRQRP